jgi:hypothetical protein
VPIKPENRQRYPADWPAISARIRYERAGNRCEQCNVTNHELGGRDAEGRWHAAQPLDCARRMPAPGTWAWCDGGHHLRIVRIVLTVAHLDHTPENCADDNLKALCQRCHLHLDRHHHAETARRTRLAKAGQVALPL